jgi:hypothetical protein
LTAFRTAKRDSINSKGSLMCRRAGGKYHGGAA